VVPWLEYDLIVFDVDVYLNQYKEDCNNLCIPLSLSYTHELQGYQSNLRPHQSTTV